MLMRLTCKLMSVPRTGHASYARLPFVLLLLTLLVLSPAPPAHAGEAAETARTVLVTGANRGIGLEFVRQYAAAGWDVIATCRSPDSAEALQALARTNPAVRIEQLDVTDDAQIARLAGKYADRPLHLLINNAALLGTRSDQLFGNQDFRLAAQQFEVNALGPLRVTQAFIDNIRAAGPGKIIVLGSAAGSNGYLQPPADFYSYRASKAAGHFLAHNMGMELQAEGIVVGLINPGLVDTRGFADIGPDDPVPDDFKQVVKLIRAGAIELQTPQESVAAMRALIGKLTVETNGSFLNYDGQTIPW